MATEKWENTIQNCLAFYHQGRYREALPLAEKALNLALQEFGTKHPNTGGSLFQLARLHYALGRYEKAERFYQRTLAVVELVLGSDHPNAAACLSGLAELYRQWGRYKEAEPLFLRALAIQEGTLGPEHPDVAETLGDLAGLYYQQGRYLEAEQRYQPALRILELTLPHNHPDIATLNLDAQWVFLPCCHTAASDGTPGAEGLSGLAKAFLYAGARTLLVSHWAVGSQAAKLLTTGMISELDEHPEIGRAEAPRRAMLDLIDGPPNPDPEESAGSAYLAHPAFWAPLIVVGEGGRWPPIGDGISGGAEQCPSRGPHRQPELPTPEPAPQSEDRLPGGDGCR